MGIAFDFVETLCDELRCHGMVAEYPQYGLYKDAELKCDKILEDSLRIYDFAKNTLGFLPQNILIFGRSIGSAPATYLAS